MLGRISKKTISKILNYIVFYVLMFMALTFVFPRGVKAAGYKDELATMEVHFLDVGQGDSTLITCGGEAMLIDAGDENSGYVISDYLMRHGVNKLKYFVLTHPDADHVGGADTVMYQLDKIDLVIKDNKNKNTLSYRELNDMIKYLNIDVQNPKYGKKYTLGGATITLVGVPLHGDESNNDSIVVIADYANTSFIFPGDAMEAEENAIIDKRTNLKCDVLKVGHHGSRSSTSEKFFKAVAPKYAVISCGEDNPYGHPHADTLNKLRDSKVRVFRTDEQGTIVAVSDGNKIEWNCFPSESWKTGKGSKRDTDPIKEKKDEGSSSNSTVSNAAKASSVVAGASKQPNNEAASGDTANIRKSQSDDGRKSKNKADESLSKEQLADNTQSDSSILASYIANTHTRKFHYPTCKSVKQMNDNNKMEFSGSRDELINQGYVPCKHCNP